MHSFPGLHVHLLGGFRLLQEGKLLTAFAQDRLQALLAYLLLHRHTPLPRQFLAFLFWPDSSEAQARTNLRQLLHHLQRALPEADHYLQVENQTLQWRPEAVFTLDVAEFERDAIGAEEATREGRHTVTRKMLESAVQRYQGDLLPGCYDEWIFPERERLSQMYFSALEQLVSLAEAQRDYRGAIAYAEQLLRRDSLRETTYQHLMRLHGLNGDRARGLQIYHLCVTTLERELGVDPSAETRQGYFKLLSRQAPEIAKPARRRISSARSALVGRQVEWNELQAAWRDSTTGHARLVIISGEAGIGKTRLAEEFLEWAGQEGASTAKARSYSAEGQLVYAPVTELLRADLFRGALSSLAPVWLIELARLMPELLEGEADIGKPEPITSSWQRKHLFEALARAIKTARESLVLLFDDLQWCDQDTVEWLHYLLRVSAESRLLVIGTVRVEEIDGGHRLSPILLDTRSRDQLTEIELGPLGKGDATLLAQQIAGEQIGADEAARLYLQSEGNPLFLVEMVRAANGQVASGRATGAAQVARTDSVTQPRPSIDLPSRVYGLMQARLGQLSPAARELAGLAATIGRVFSIDVLSLASGMDDEALVRGLDELWRRRIVREQGGPCYDFSHDLIREVAYLEMSAARRGLLHRRVARALEQLHATNLDEVSSQVAAHFGQAGLAREAIAYYQRAIQVAQATFSNAEIIRLAETALSLLPPLPGGREKNESELRILISLATAHMLSKGYGHPSVEQTLLRAWELIQALEGSAHTIPVLAGIWL
ncbi:MAG: ATP-binding protein, partial [Nitrososphaerales archaeon]